MASTRPAPRFPSRPASTPETGDLIGRLPGWELSGKVTEAKSGISVEVPLKGSTLTAEGDVTTGQLTANLSIPPINQTILIGLHPGNRPRGVDPDRHHPRDRRADRRRRVQ